MVIWRNFPITGRRSARGAVAIGDRSSATVCAVATVALLPGVMSFVRLGVAAAHLQRCGSGSGSGRALCQQGRITSRSLACLSGRHRGIAMISAEKDIASPPVACGYNFCKQATRFESSFADASGKPGGDGEVGVVPITLLHDKGSFKEWLRGQPTLVKSWVKALGNASFKSGRIVLVPSVLASPTDGAGEVSSPGKTGVEVDGGGKEEGSESETTADGSFLSEVAYCLGDADDTTGSPFSLCSLYDQLPPGKYLLRGAAGAALANPDAASLSWALGSYSFSRYKSKGISGKQEGGSKEGTEDGSVMANGDVDADGGGDAQEEGTTSKVLIWPEGVSKKRVSTAAASIFLVRDLVTTPCEDMGPQHLEDVMLSLAQEFGAVPRVVKGDDLLKPGDSYPMIHSVGRAAAEGREPRLLDLTWTPAGFNGNLPKVTLIGKGVCFDTGGLDIKSASGMASMKKDMGGGAQVLGLARMVMSAGLPIRLRVLVPAVENAISGGAFRPGDVITSRDGKSTEIGNTDAEGRLVLADALVDASSEQPDLMIDCATLTGAARVALGAEVPAMFCNDDGVAARLQELSVGVHDQVWRLPLWDSYRKQLSSKIADLKNIGSGGYGGAITAALYLEEFVGKNTSPGISSGAAATEVTEVTEACANGAGERTTRATGQKLRWIHVDFMAFNQASRPGRPEGGEAQGMRALYALLEDIYGGGGFGEKLPVFE